MQDIASEMVAMTVACIMRCIRCLAAALLPARLRSRQQKQSLTTVNEQLTAQLAACKAEIAELKLLQQEQSLVNTVQVSDQTDVQSWPTCPAYMPYCLAHIPCA